MNEYYEIEHLEEGSRILLFNENWYVKEIKDESIIYKELYPSVTFIQGVEIDKSLLSWFKEHGIYSEEIANVAKIIGSLFHNMIEVLLKTGYIEHTDFQHHQHFLKAWKRLPNFMNFYTKHLQGHEILGIEKVIFHDELRYAGTVDLLTKLGDELHIWDWKSSKQVHDHHKSQIAAYCKAVGATHGHVVCFPEFPTTKQGYSLTTISEELIDEYFEEFLFIKQKFDRNVKEPIIKTLPIKIKLGE